VPRFKLSHTDEVDAIQFTGDNAEEVIQWGLPQIRKQVTDNQLEVQYSPNGWMDIPSGSWVVFGPENGEVNVYDNETFKSMYESTEMPA
jgi:hypothetical protein